MGCIKLDILEKSFVPMKVVYSSSDVEQKSVQRFLSVDPLWEKYTGASPYNYCGGNPVDYMDATGLFKTRLLASISRKWYNIWHKDEAGPIYQAKKNGEYEYNSIDRSGDGVYCIVTHYKFSTKAAETTQNIGLGLSVSGYFLTLTVVGAETGVPLSSLGNTISGVGALWQLGVDYLNDGSYVKDMSYFVIERISDFAMKKICPFVNESKYVEKDIGNRILRQGVSLKVTGAEKVTDAIIENKK